MIFPRSTKKVHVAESSPSLSQHNPHPCWLKQRKKLPQCPGLPRSRRGQDLARSCVCSKSAKIVVHRTCRNASWITIMEFSVFLIIALHQQPSAVSDSITPTHTHTHTPTVCLSVHLSVSFPHFLFYFPCQSLAKSPSVHLCLFVSVSLVSANSAHCLSLQISNMNHSSPLIPTPSPSPLHLHPCSSWCESTLMDGMHPQVYPQVWSLLAEPPSCDRSMTEPVTAAHRYSQIDCIWKTMCHAVN